MGKCRQLQKSTGEKAAQVQQHKGPQSARSTPAIADETGHRRTRFHLHSMAVSSRATGSLRATSHKLAEEAWEVEQRPQTPSIPWQRLKAKGRQKARARTSRRLVQPLTFVDGHQFVLKHSLLSRRFGSWSLSTLQQQRHHMFERRGITAAGKFDGHSFLGRAIRPAMFRSLPLQKCGGDVLASPSMGNGEAGSIAFIVGAGRSGSRRAIAAVP